MRSAAGVNERRIRLIEKKYFQDLWMLRRVAELKGFLLWRPKAQRLYAYGDHQAAYMYVSIEDITYDMLGDDDTFYRFDLFSDILILTSIIPTDEEVRESYEDCFSKSGEPLARIAIDDENRCLIPDALNFIYEWRVGSGKLAYIKKTSVNLLIMNEKKTLLGRWDDGKLKAAIVLLKNNDRKPRELKMVKHRIFTRSEDAYRKLFGLS